MKPKRVHLAVLLAIVAAALFVRVRGIGHQLPHWTYWDGYVLLDQSAYLRGELDAELPRKTLGYYPYLTAAVAANLPSAVPDMMSSRGEGGAREEPLAAARAPWIRLRLSSILLSTLAVFGAWGIARRFVSQPFALLAAALTATSLLHVTYSAEQRPHGPASGTAAIAVWALMHFRRDGSWRAFAVALAALGFALSALQSNLALLLCALLALLMRRERLGWKRASAMIACALAVLALVVRCAYPFHFDDREGAVAPFDPGEDALWLAGHPIFLGRLNGGGFATLASSFAMFDPVLTALLALAVIAALVRLVRPSSHRDVDARGDVWLCAGYVAPFLFVFGVYGSTYDRFALPLIPFASIAAAWGLEAIWNSLPLKLHTRSSAAFALVSVLVFPCATAARLASQRASPDTFELAADWLVHDEQAVKSRVFLMQNFDLPLLYAADSFDELNDSQTLFWTMYQRARPETHPAEALSIARPPRSTDDESVDFVNIDWLRRHSFDYVVSLPPPRGLRASETLDALRKLRKELESVAVFAPTAEIELKKARGSAPNTSITESGTASRLWSVDRSGPRVEIFRVPPQP